MIIAVSTVIQNNNKEILLVQEHNGKFNLPGGHLEEGETIANGAIREAREEVNLEIELEYLIGLYHRKGRIASFVFFTTLFKNQAVAQKSEILDCAWFSVEALHALKNEDILNPHWFRMIMDDLADGRKYSIKIIREMYG